MVSCFERMILTNMSLVCRGCTQTLPLERFTRDGARRKRCRACVSRAAREGGEAHRLLVCVRAQCRKRGWPWASVWTIDDIRALLAATPPPCIGARRVKVRVVRRDESKPFVPDNAVVRAYGMGLSA